jgi:hypothetical protein
MRFAFVAAAVLLCTTTMTEAKSDGCFRHAEAVADQGIRYMTDVMVMSDTCRNDTYARFAYRNRSELADFQHALMARFSRLGGGGQAKLDQFMTHIANEAALRTGVQDIAQVCAVASQFLATADALTGQDFRAYIEQQVDQHKSDYKLCKN